MTPLVHDVSIHHNTSHNVSEKLCYQLFLNKTDWQHEITRPPRYALCQKGEKLLF